MLLSKGRAIWGKDIVWYNDNDDHSDDHNNDDDIFKWFTCDFLVYFKKELSGLDSGLAPCFIQLRQNDI